MNINDLFQASKDVEDSSNDFASALSPADLTDGETYNCEVVHATTRPAKSGLPSYSFKFKILAGDLVDNEFWSNLYFSANKTDGALRYNKQMFAKLAALGIGESFLAQNPSPEAIAKAAVGSQLKFKVKLEEDDEYGTGISSFSSWAPLSAESASYVPGQAPQGF